MKALLRGLHDQRYALLQIADDNHSNLRKCMEILYERTLSSARNSFFDIAEALKLRATQGAVVTRNHTQSPVELALGKFMDLRIKVDNEITRLVNDSQADKLLKGLALTPQAKSLRVDPQFVPEDPAYQRCPFCGLHTLNEDPIE